jgi:hypothetical protein
MAETWNYLGFKISHIFRTFSTIPCCSDEEVGRGDVIDHLAKQVEQTLTTTQISILSQIEEGVNTESTNEERTE